MEKERLFSVSSINADLIQKLSYDEIINKLQPGHADVCARACVCVQPPAAAEKWPLYRSLESDKLSLQETIF